MGEGLLKIATVFSGVGAFEQALLKKSIQYEIVFACDTGERYVNINVDKLQEQLRGLPNKDREKFVSSIYDSTKKKNYVKESYFANYKIDLFSCLQSSS